MRIFIDWLLGVKTQAGVKPAEPVKTTQPAKPRTFTLQLFRALGRH